VPGFVNGKGTMVSEVDNLIQEFSMYYRRYCPCQLVGKARYRTQLVRRNRRPLRQTRKRVLRTTERRYDDRYVGSLFCLLIYSFLSMC
jgi:hypothetical protein